jgi:hypothetical protein
MKDYNASKEFAPEIQCPAGWLGSYKVRGQQKLQFTRESVSGWIEVSRQIDNSLKIQGLNSCVKDYQYQTDPGCADREIKRGTPMWGRKSPNSRTPILSGVYDQPQIRSFPVPG